MISKYLSLIKFSHTLFALPFALVGFIIGIHEPTFEFTFTKLLLVILCMVFGRSAAMAFNRWQDRDIDLLNERTKVREIPSGLIQPKSALYFVIFSSLAFIISTYFINTLCFALSPIALIIILGYSYTKRFTALCHLILGLGLSLAPIGAYLAVTGHFSMLPILYSGSVLFWVAGFDIIYALQDESFDKSQNLKSIPVVTGGKKALMWSNILHFISAFFIITAAFISTSQFHQLNIIHLIGLIIFLILLAYQHTLVKSDDLSKVNLAFFTTNGVASVIFGTLYIVDFYL